MATASSTGDGASSPLLRVLSDPSLLTCVTSFQAGMPQVLYDFWTTRDPSVTRSTRDLKLADRILHFYELLVAHGSTDLLRFLDHVRYHDRSSRVFKWVAPGQWQVARLAITSNRVDMLQWAIDHNKLQAGATELWADAFSASQGNHGAVLDLLKQHHAIELSDVEEILKRRKIYEILTSSVGLVAWLHANMAPIIVPLARKLMLAAVKRGDLAMVCFVSEHMPLEGLGLQALGEAYRKDQLDILDYLVERAGNGTGLEMESDLDSKLQRRLLCDTRRTVQAVVRRHVDVFRVGIHGLTQRAAASGDLSQLQAWHESGLLAQITPIPIERLLHVNALPTIRFLHEHDVATVTTEAMDMATEKGMWDIVDFLHVHRS